MTLSRVKHINVDWCEFVLKHCDFSNISDLTLNQVTFNDKSIVESFLKQLASKITNLIYFGHKFDRNVLLFWQFLHGIISTNTVSVELILENLKDDELNELKKMMDELHLQTDKLNLSYLVINYKMNDAKKEFISSREKVDLGLKHLVIKFLDPDAVAIVNRKLTSKLSFKSIDILEVRMSNSSLSDVNAFLGLNIIFLKRLFIIGDFGIPTPTEDKLVSSFKVLCQNIYKLFTEQIGVDINIEFRYNEDEETIMESCFAICSSYFGDSNLFLQYSKPKSVSNLCFGRERPFLHFENKKNHR